MFSLIENQKINVKIILIIQIFFEHEEYLEFLNWILSLIGSMNELIIGKIFDILKYRENTTYFQFWVNF